ncbi:MAG: amino acid permease [Dehalococcoidia bacterium]|nr:MAG: amino acid permease [Dehalococcoidia bacterium]
MAQPAGPPPPPPRLRRALGLWSVTTSGIGIVLGAGIYVLVGEAAADAGGATWVAFLAAALLAGVTAFTFAELAGMFPEAGASAVYAEEAFGARAGFVTGWLDVTVNVVGAGAVALGLGGYAQDLFGLEQRAVAAAVIAVCALIVYVGVRETAGLSMIFAGIEGGGLLLVIAVGLPDLPPPSFFDAPHGLSGILAATALVFFAYEGFEEMVSLSEETRDPTSTIPRAVLLAVGVTSLFYLMVAMVATAVVPWEELAASSAPLALVVKTATHDRLGDVLSVIALFATFNTVLLLLATGARITYGMANRRLLPGVLARVSRRGTPLVATLTLSTIALGFMLSGNIGFVAQVTTFAVFGQFLAVNAAVIALRRSRADRVRPFRIRGTVAGMPVTALIALGTTVLFVAFMDRGALVTGVAALALGFLVSLLVLRGREAGVHR